MDESDKELLNEIQWTFPLVSRPFDAIAKKFDTTSEDIKSRLNELKEIEPRHEKIQEPFSLFCAVLIL